MTLSSFIRNAFQWALGQPNLDDMARLLLKTPEGRFRGSLVNINDQLKKAAAGLPVSYESFPVDGSSDPADRSSEFIYLNLHKGIIGGILDKVIDDTTKELSAHPAFLKIIDQKAPAVADWREWESILYKTVADKLTASNPDFFQYRLGVNLNTGKPTGCIKTQHLTDLDVDLQKPTPKTYEQNYYKYVCNCETFSTLVGPAAQTVANNLLGENNSGRCFYAIASSNYRVDERDRVEHAMLMTSRKVTLNDGSRADIAAFVDPSVYNLGIRGIYQQGDRDYTPDQIVKGVRFISHDSKGFGAYYAVDLPLPPPDAFVPAPAPKLPDWT
jgi:hypothetical protein